MVASSRGVNSEVITITIIKVFKLCVHILKVERTEFPGRVVPGKQQKRMRGIKNDPKDFGLSHLLSLERYRRSTLLGEGRCNWRIAFVCTHIFIFVDALDFFLSIRVFIHYHLLQSTNFPEYCYRSTSNKFSLSENSFISPAFLKDIFSGLFFFHRFQDIFSLCSDRHAF